MNTKVFNYEGQISSQQPLVTDNTTQGRASGAFKREVKEEEEQPKQLEGQFFDDFDQAFGSDNDVPILDMNKAKEKAKETTILH